MLIIFLVFGLIVGSFLNVVIYRLKDAETLLGRSLCRHCRKQIRWYDNIPLISFVLLRGQCRDCSTGISWQYPVVEGLTGILFAFIGALFYSAGSQAALFETIWLLGLVSCLVVIVAYDLKYLEIPMSILIVSGLWTFGYLLSTLAGAGGALWFSPFALGMYGSLVVGGFFLALVVASRETWMGWGDVWLGFVVGAAVGLPSVLMMLTLSFGIGALVGIALMARKGKTLKSQIPFAPFLVVGMLLALLLPRLMPQWAYFFFL